MSKNLEDLIAKYKQELTNAKSNNIELEIRYKNVDFNMFNAIYNHFLSTIDKKNIVLTQIISCIIKVKNGINQFSTNNIKNKYYKNKKMYKDEYISKTPLIVPVQDSLYLISLSVEKGDIPRFIIDESAIIRVKNRVTFHININDVKWKLDMTIVRQISGNEISSSLKQIVHNMFKQHDVTIDNILYLFNENKISQKIYKYEIELELINNPEQKLIPTNIVSTAKYILFISNPNYEKEIILQNKIYEIATYLIKSPLTLAQYQNKYGLKQLLPKVIALTRYDYRNIYPLMNYYITCKADGIRSIGICSSEGGFIISDTLLQSKDVSENITIVDGELINNILYAFDVIVYRSKNVSSEIFENRLLLLSKAVEELVNAGLSVVAKEYVLIHDLEQDIKTVYNKKYPYEIDGLIFVKPGDPYNTTKSYKWKDNNHTTIDFLVKKAPTSVLGLQPFIPKKDHTIYFLFVGISNDMYQALGLRTCVGYNEIFIDNNTNNYFPIQFSVSNAPYAFVYYHPNNSSLNIENSIVEFRCINNCTATEGIFIDWEPIKIRNDRKKDLESKTYYGNDYKIAEITWINYMDPFPLEQLWLNISSDEYFASNKLGIYHAQTSVISFLKNERILSFKHSNWILDIGSGKGQDLGRYFNAKIHNLIAVDNDKASLAELIRRKYTFIQDKSKHNVKTNVKIVLANMTDNYEAILEKIGNNKINVIVCNLSIHYYIYNHDLLINFINLVNRLLVPSGHIVITCMFGENVFELLKTVNMGEAWTCYEGDIIKYSIKKLYSSKKIEQFGQNIGIVLPFSNNTYYEEYLININNLIREFTKYKFDCIIKQNINDKVLENFKLKNLSVFSKLTTDDMTYLSLYGELVFIKRK